MCVSSYYWRIQQVYISLLIKELFKTSRSSTESSGWSLTLTVLIKIWIHCQLLQSIMLFTGAFKPGPIILQTQQSTTAFARALLYSHKSTYLLSLHLILQIYMIRRDQLVESRMQWPYKTFLIQLMRMKRRRMLYLVFKIWLSSILMFYRKKIRRLKLGILHLPYQFLS